MQLVGLRGTRMKFYLENILAGKVSVATAAKQAQRVKSRLRFRNYLLDSISILRQGNMTWGEAEITWEWLRKNEIVPQSLEDQYCSFFKSNVPEPRYQKEIDEKIKNCWNQWVSLGVPLLPSSDNEQGGGWLKKNYPGEGTSNVIQFFHGPNSKILLIRCKTEVLPTYILPQVFRKSLDTLGICYLVLLLLI